jgi:hypothetical protein
VRSLRAANTIEVYEGAARQFLAYLRAERMPTAATEVSREHVEAFLDDLLSRPKALGGTVRSPLTRS